MSTAFYCGSGTNPAYLFDEVKPYIDLIGGTLSGDDTIIDKPYSAPAMTELMGYFWSGKHHRVVKGIQPSHIVLHRESRQVYPYQLSHLQQTIGQDQKRLFERND